MIRPFTIYAFDSYVVCLTDKSLVNDYYTKNTAYYAAVVNFGLVNFYHNFNEVQLKDYVFYTDIFCENK